MPAVSNEPSGWFQKNFDAVNLAGSLAGKIHEFKHLK